MVCTSLNEPSFRQYIFSTFLPEKTSGLILQWYSSYLLKQPAVWYTSVSLDCPHKRGSMLWATQSMECEHPWFVHIIYTIVLCVLQCTFLLRLVTCWLDFFSWKWKYVTVYVCVFLRSPMNLLESHARFSLNNHANEGSDDRGSVGLSSAQQLLQDETGRSISADANSNTPQDSYFSFLLLRHLHIRDLRNKVWLIWRQLFVSSISCFWSLLFFFSVSQYTQLLHFSWAYSHN